MVAETKLERLAFVDELTGTMNKNALFSDFENIVIGEPVNTYVSLQSYKDRVETYIRKNKDHLTINKLCNNIQITKKELDELENILFTEGVAGTKEEFVQQYGKKPLGTFIRSITGLNEKSVNEAFSYFLQIGNLRADQMTFIRTIMSPTFFQYYFSNFFSYNVEFEVCYKLEITSFLLSDLEAKH